MRPFTRICSLNWFHMRMFNIATADLFPTWKSFIIFVTYIALFVGQGIFITASQGEKSNYSYNTTTLVMLTEFVKLFVALVLFTKDNNIMMLISELVKNMKVIVFYVVPSAMYAIYNNLAFYNLSIFDPTTYYVLLQLRVVMNAVIFQIVFSKKLSGKQWLSLLLLTVGCIIKQIDPPQKSGHEHSTVGLTSLFRGDVDGAAYSKTVWALALLGVQTVCSCFAGVYNEYLIKDRFAEVHVMLQNVFMYFDSVLVNVVILGWRGDIGTAFTAESLGSVLSTTPLVVLAVNAAIGIVTSLFLKHLNSILKSYASIIELMFTAVIAWLLFSIPINAFTVMSVFIVSCAVLLYAQNPVVNRGRLDEVERGKIDR